MRFAAHLVAQRDAGRQRDISGDDGNGRHHTLVEITDMHRSTLALAATGAFAEQLVHQRFDAQPARNGMTVRPVGAGDDIFFVECKTNTDSRCFLSLALMDGAGHVSLEEEHFNAFFEKANQQHAFVHGEHLLLAVRRACS